MKLPKLLYVWILAIILGVIGIVMHVTFEIVVAIFFAVLISAAILAE